MKKNWLVFKISRIFSCIRLSCEYHRSFLVTSRTILFFITSSKTARLLDLTGFSKQADLERDEKWKKEKNGDEKFSRGKDRRPKSVGLEKKQTKTSVASCDLFKTRKISWLFNFVLLFGLLLFSILKQLHNFQKMLDHDGVEEQVLCFCSSVLVLAFLRNWIRQQRNKGFDMHSLRKQRSGMKKQTTHYYTTPDKWLRWRFKNMPLPEHYCITSCLWNF